MTKHKDPLAEALKEGKSYTWTAPDGGYFASMRNAIKHGQTLTMSPIGDPSEIQVGDMVLVKWHQGDIFHLVGEIQGEQYLIVNSLGKVNGWVTAKEIMGRITKVVDPEPRPELPVILEQLEAAYRTLIQLDQTAEEDALRLLSIVDDLRWYADRLGAERWDVYPRTNKWTLIQNLWHLTKEAKKMEAPVQDRVRFIIDRGKMSVGQAGEIFSLLEYEGLEEA
jgi:hypothetical protein